MPEIPLNGFMFLEKIEENNNFKVPLNLRSIIISELNLRHQRYLNLLGLVTHISRLDSVVFSDLLSNLTFSHKRR